MMDQNRKHTVETALQKVKDPEIGLDIVKLNLIRGISEDIEGIKILMTLTSPFCPFADSLIGLVEKEVSKIEGAGLVRVDITFDPPWEPSPELRETLGL